jgi:hypothetical protein
MRAAGGGRRGAQPPVADIPADPRPARHRSPPDDLSGQSGRASGMDPYEVGLRVVDGVRSDQPYIFTHTQYRPQFAERFQAILAGVDRAAAFVMPKQLRD